MSSLAVRAMEERDLDTVVEIESLSFSDPWTRAAFLKEIEENKLAVYLVAEIDGEVAGYIGMWNIVGEGHITNIAVMPECRGRGIGDALLAGLIEAAKKLDIEDMTLEVRVSNIQAQKLYKKHGFESEGIRPKYYENNEDAIVMWNRFKNK